MAVFIRDYDCDYFVIPCSSRERAAELAEQFEGQTWEAPPEDYQPPVVTYFSMRVAHWAPNGQPKPTYISRPTEAEEVRVPVWPDMDPSFSAPDLNATTAVAHWSDPADPRYWPYVNLHVEGPTREEVEDLFNVTLDRINVDWPQSWWELASGSKTERKIAREGWGRELFGVRGEE